MNAEDPCSICGGIGLIGAGQLRCDACEGTGRFGRFEQVFHENSKCEVSQCNRYALPNRKICEFHAYPAARKKGTTGRRAAIEATKKKQAEREAKVSSDSTEEETNG